MQTPPGELTQPISLLDLAPTIAAYAGIAAPPDWEGKDLFSPHPSPTDKK
jgi:arylsulfatase A-like enzyme